MGMTRTPTFLVAVVTVAVVTALGVGAVGASTQWLAGDAISQTDGQTDDIRVRIVHASPDAPPVDVSVDGQVVASSLAYGEVAFVPVEQAGNYSVEIAAAANETEDNESAVLYSENLTLEAGTDYTIAAAGEVTEGAATTFEPLVIVENATTVGDDVTAVGLVHLSPDAPAVDVTENTTGEVVFENVSYRNATEQVTLPAGNYTLDVRVESETNDGEIVESVDVSLEGGATYTAFAIGYAAAENVTEEQAFTVLLSNDAGMEEGMNETEEGTETEMPTEEEMTTEPATETVTTESG